MMSVCSGCGLELPAAAGTVNRRVNASAECLKLSHELSFYTLERGDTFFIHQAVVDAYASQHYKKGSPKIGLAFALIGLCLLVEHGYTGKQIQNAHIRLAKLTKDWPEFAVPEKRGALTVADALKEEPGQKRDEAIIQWAKLVWSAYEKTHESVRECLRKHGEI